MISEHLRGFNKLRFLQRKPVYRIGQTGVFSKSKTVFRCESEYIQNQGTPLDASYEYCRFKNNHLRRQDNIGASSHNFSLFAVWCRADTQGAWSPHRAEAACSARQSALRERRGRTVFYLQRLPLAEPLLAYA